MPGNGAQQARTGSNRQTWGFVVVTDPQKRAALADIYRRVWESYSRSQAVVPEGVNPATIDRVRDSARYLAEHIHEVPVHVMTVIHGRTDNASMVGQAGVWGSILPAAWSFMLARPARGASAQPGRPFTCATKRRPRGRCAPASPTPK